MRPSPLDWGRHYLMCPPDHFEVVYEINPWMDRRIAVDRDLAAEQWDRLTRTILRAGATIELMDPHYGLPDLVFTANAGLVTGRRAVVSRFRNEERAGETPHDEAWFRQHGFETVTLPGDLRQEGAGDALPFQPRENAEPLLVAGYGIRSDCGAAGALARRLGVRVEPLELADPRFYHLDLGFCPLAPGRAMVVPDAFTAPSRRRLERLVDEPLVLDLDDALTFCANSLVIGSTVIMPECPPSVGRRLEAWGYDVAVSPVSEFHKAGGACRCLTLALDVDVRRRAPALAA